MTPITKESHRKLNGWNDNRTPSMGKGGEGSFEESLLTPDERLALKKSGIEVKTFYAVLYPQSNEVIAIFKHELWAKEWKDKNCVTAIIEPYEFQIK